MGRYAHPEITMHSLSFGEYMRYIEAGEWENVASLIMSSVVKVAKAGAHFVICPDNTIHQAFHIVIKKSPIPWLHIAEEVTAEAKRQNYKRLGVLGTRFLMEGPVYPDVLNAMGIDYQIPGTKDRERINEIIFHELVWGRFSQEARSYLNEVIGRFKNQGCDAVILGCTEIPLLVTRESSPLPTLDSTRLLARAALKKAVAITPQ
jgi:aspartate racemase